jgi:hypothetical protein
MGKKEVSPDIVRWNLRMKHHALLGALATFLIRRMHGRTLVFSFCIFFSPLERVFVIKLNLAGFQRLKWQTSRFA